MTTMKTKRKTIQVSEVSKIAMASGNEKKISKVIHEGVVKQWVGIGWVEIGKPTPDELDTLHHVVSG